jgi:hypothetical protein
LEGSASERQVGIVAPPCCRNRDAFRLRALGWDKALAWSEREGGGITSQQRRERGLYAGASEEAGEWRAVMISGKPLETVQRWKICMAEHSRAVVIKKRSLEIQ